MKKINFFIIFTLLICQNIHSLELWNGFTDEMTKNQVISRAIKLFNAKTKENSLFGNTFSSGMELFFNEKQRTEHYFSFADVIYYNSPNKEFQYDISGNIRFYFIENTLYAIDIEWSPQITEFVIEKAIESYGSNYTIFDAHGGYNDSKPTILWNFADKEIYLNEFCQTTGYEPFAKLSIFSKAKLEKGKVLLKQQEEDVQNKKIKELKQAVDSIKF